MNYSTVPSFSTLDIVRKHNPLCPTAPDVGVYREKKIGIFGIQIGFPKKKPLGVGVGVGFPKAKFLGVGIGVGIPDDVFFGIESDFGMKNFTPAGHYATTVTDGSVAICYLL